MRCNEVIPLWDAERHSMEPNLSRSTRDGGTSTHSERYVTLMMFKKKWLATLGIMLILVITVGTFAIILHSQAPVTAIQHVNCHSQQSVSSSVVQICPYKLLIFSKTAAFRHASIKDGKLALQKLAVAHNVAIDFTEDSTAFTDTNLKQYNAVVFLLTTGEILDGSQQAAFERYIHAGGGYLGIHSATDTEYNWSWYGKLVGAYFDRIHGHSHVTQATLHVVDHTHPSTSMLPASWIRTDEWYNFASNPRPDVHVLITIDEKTYKGGVMGADHPIAWYHDFEGGRAWYTALGHTSESYSEPLFLAHLWGGIIYAASISKVYRDGQLYKGLEIPLQSPLNSKDEET
jgi:type 1 glutamine amidotransferase